MILQFVGSPSFLSGFIEYKGGWAFSHVDCVLPDGRLLGARSDVIGGAPAGVQIRRPDYDEWASVSRVTITSTTEQEKAFWDFLNQQIGKPYDKLAIFAFIINRNWMETDCWFCSELQTAAMVKADLFKFPLSMPFNKIDPNLCFALASTIGEVEKVK